MIFWDGACGSEEQLLRTSWGLVFWFSFVSVSFEISNRRFSSDGVIAVVEEMEERREQ